MDDISDSMKIAVGIEYNGIRFFGWQRQKHAPSVQQHVEQALSIVANEPIYVKCAGRTDTGVHALQQVIHFETTVQRPVHSWVLGSNINLPGDISVTWAKPVVDDFDARYSAVARVYRYLILNRLSRPGLMNGYVTWIHRPLDVELMSRAAADLIGEHDFTSYRAKSCQSKNPVRKVSRIDISRQDDLIFIEVEANAFLQHMIRNIAGVLMEIGMGRKGTNWAKQILLDPELYLFWIGNFHDPFAD